MRNEKTHLNTRIRRSRFALIIGILAVLLYGCDDFILWDVISHTVTPPDGSELTISPTSTETPVGSNLSFYASGGTPPYSYTIVSGSGSINSDGLYTAPDEASVDVIRVFDESGASDDAQVVVY